LYFWIKLNIIKKIISFIGSYILQSLLAIVAFFSWEEAIDFGSKTLIGEGSFNKNYRDFNNVQLVPTDVDVTAGFEGGALAMGLICCVCIIMIVWIEINKNPKP